MLLSTTLFYAALLTLVLMGLSVRVVFLRRRHHVGIGAGGHPELQRAIRAHANFCEYVPLALLLLVLLEAAAAVPAGVLHVLGLALVAGRIAHAIGLNRSPGTSAGRFIGTLLTWLMLLAGAFYGLYLSVGRMLLA